MYLQVGKKGPDDPVQRGAPSMAERLHARQINTNQSTIFFVSWLDSVIPLPSMLSTLIAISGAGRVRSRHREIVFFI
jgi:hypothetical protein